MEAKEKQIAKLQSLEKAIAAENENFVRLADKAAMRCRCMMPRSPALRKQLDASSKRSQQLKERFDALKAEIEPEDVTRQ